MKKIFICLVMFFCSMPVFASNKVVIESENDFSSVSYSEQFEARILEENTFENGVTLEKDSIVKGLVVKMVEAKRGKRDAYIVLKPLTYTVPSKESVEKFNDDNWMADVVGYKPIDKQGMVLSAGTTVGGYFVKGFGQMFYFAKGLALPNEGQNRIESGIKNVYDNSPLAYFESGKILDIKKGDTLILKFYHSDIPKWQYTKRNK